MAIPEYFQDISAFDNPDGHPDQLDFVSEGLTTSDPLSGNLIWNTAGRAVINEIISTRFELAISIYDLLSALEAQLPDPTIARQIISRGYYSMYTAARAVSLSACLIDHGAGGGGHINIVRNLDPLTNSDPWYPSFHDLLRSWKELRHCADYNLLTRLIYPANPRHPYTTQFRHTNPGFPDLLSAALVVCPTVEDYLRESQRFILGQGYHLGRTL